MTNGDPFFSERSEGVCHSVAEAEYPFAHIDDNCDGVGTQSLVHIDQRRGHVERKARRHIDHSAACLHDRTREAFGVIATKVRSKAIWGYPVVPLLY